MEWIDRSFLKKDAYQQPGKLEARMSLHARFSLNKEPWQSWVFDRLGLEPGMNVLDVGCGTALLWAENLNRLPGGLSVTLADLSAGMAARACGAVAPGRGGARFTFLAGDVQRLPFGDGQFDMVVANHMLYHVPDLPAAVGEMRRVLAPGGRLRATANGPGHMQELGLLAGQKPGETTMEMMDARFGMASAEGALASSFGEIEVIEYPDGLWITEAGPLLDYVQTMFKTGAPPPDLNALREQVEARIREEGGYRVTKRSCIVRAVRA